MDGCVAGIWHQHRARRTLDLTVEPFDELTPARRRALDDEAGRLGEFSGSIPRLIIGAVTSGCHAWTREPQPFDCPTTSSVEPVSDSPASAGRASSCRKPQASTGQLGRTARPRASTR